MRVNGYAYVECPTCGENNWHVKVSNDCDGSRVVLKCVTYDEFTEGPCSEYITICINQEMTMHS